MADFRTAVLITIDPNHEGGYQNSPHDHANWSSGKIGEGELIGTKYGITAVDLPGVDIKNLTPDQAVTYYKEHYWKPLFSQITSQEVANKLFDMGVLFGVGTAVYILQATLKPAFPEVETDHVFGPTTLNAVNNSDDDSLLGAYKISLIQHAKRVAEINPEEANNVNGWSTRIHS